VHEGLLWRPVSQADAPAIMALSGAALAVDGGSPFAAAEWLIRRWYTGGTEASLAALDGGEMVGACARRPAAEPGGPARIAGVVAPGRRGQGIGGRLLDFALTGVRGPVLAETECLTGPADALFRGRGLRQTFAEDVMSMPLRNGPQSADAGPRTADAGSRAAHAAPELAFTEWTPAAAPRFFAMWEAAFRDRPGFPGWSAATWIEWISDDEDFRADWTLLASRGGADVGFVAGAAGGWIVQVGVIPAARGMRISAALMGEVFRRMVAAGESRTMLNVKK